MPRKIWGSSQDGAFEYVSMANEHLKESLQIIREDFIPNELLSKACEIPDNEEATEVIVELARIAANDRVSIVAIEKATGTVAAVCFNKIMNQSEVDVDNSYRKIMENCTENDSAFAYMENIVVVEEEIDLFKHFNTSCYIDMLFLTTKAKYSGKGLGHGLGQATIDLSQSLVANNNGSTRCDAPPKMIVSQLTSFASQRLAKRLGFEKVIEFPYEMFSYKGTTYASLVDSKLSQSLILKKFTL